MFKCNRVFVVQCDGLTAPDNGNVNKMCVLAGNSASYSCDDTYTLVGAATRVCGADGVWQGEAPICKRKFLYLYQNSLINKSN